MPLVGDTVTRYIRDHGFPQSKCYDLQGGLPALMNGYSISKVSQFGALASITLTEDATGNQKVLDEAEIKSLWDVTEGWTLATTRYRVIKRNPNWRGIHGVGQRPIHYEINDVAVTKTVDSVVCRSCGLVMPLESATIDHHHPQAGGQENAAIRVFRAVGLCQQQPRNRAGRTIDIQLQFDRSGPMGAELSYLGIMFYTCIHVAGEYNDFTENCLNHIVNLDPMCNRCNSSKGNWGANFS